jgi:hypothetical protein
VISPCLYLAAEGKAAKTVRTYTGAVQWFAAAYLCRQGNRTCWEEVKKRDVQEWVAWLLGRYSAAYASNHYRALQLTKRAVVDHRGSAEEVDSTLAEAPMAPAHICCAPS